MGEDYQLWDRQPNEPILWFGRFEDYRRMGPERSLLSLYTMWRIESGKSKPVSVSKAWYDKSKEWNWQQRAQAYDMWRIQEDRRRDAEEFEKDRQKAQELRRGTIKALSGIYATAVTKLGSTVKNEGYDAQDLERFMRSMAILFKESRLEFGEITDNSQINVITVEDRAVDWIKNGEIGYHDLIASGYDEHEATRLFRLANKPIPQDEED